MQVLSHGYHRLTIRFLLSRNSLFESLPEITDVDIKAGIEPIFAAIERTTECVLLDAFNPEHLHDTFLRNVASRLQSTALLSVIMTLRIRVG